MSTASQIILITGANRGIGYSTVQATALRFPQHTYILACRTPSSGSAAVTSLQKLGVTAKLDVLELDVTSNSSILAAASYISKTYSRLDVLVNNAGIALRHKDDDLNELRESYNKIFNTNITSIATLTSSFLPLLRPGGKVINISSGRASISRSVNGNLPPTAVVAYSVSKVALNALTIEFQKSENARENQGGKDEEGGGETGKKKGVEFFVVNPGHCKTEFNGYRGTKDPVDGAEVVVRLVGAENGDFKKGGFWEFEEGGMREVPW